MPQQKIRMKLFNDVKKKELTLFENLKKENRKTIHLLKTYMLIHTQRTFVL